MIKFEHSEIWGFKHAIRGMRNPLESWAKSDSDYDIDLWDGYKEEVCTIPFIAGENDLKLMKSLTKAGTDHRKFLRQIMVSVDITAPDYFFWQFDTYRMGVEKNSTSTMHRIMSKEFTKEMFSMDAVIEHNKEFDIPVVDAVVNLLNNYRDEYLETKDKRVWKALIQLLPRSYNFTRTYTISYEALYAIYHARKNHKLSEWHDFCDWVETLPYADELIVNIKPPQERIKELEKRIKDLEKDAEYFAEYIEGLEETIETLENDISEYEQEQ